MAVDRRRKDPGEVVVGLVEGRGGEEEGGPWLERTSCPEFTTFLPSSTSGSLCFPVSFAVRASRFSRCCCCSRNITLERLKKNTLLTRQKL